MNVSSIIKTCEDNGGTVILRSRTMEVNIVHRAEDNGGSANHEVDVTIIAGDRTAFSTIASLLFSTDEDGDVRDVQGYIFETEVGDSAVDPVDFVNDFIGVTEQEVTGE